MSGISSPYLAIYDLMISDTRIISKAHATECAIPGHELSALPDLRHSAFLPRRLMNQNTREEQPALWKIRAETSISLGQPGSIN